MASKSSPSPPSSLKDGSSHEEITPQTLAQGNDKQGALTTESSETYPVNWTGKRSWYRSTFTQMTILGICSFLAPGLWGAMNSLGAGGQSSPGVSTHLPR